MCGGILKSDTISFGQALVPEVIDRAMQVSEECDLLLAVGSTLAVYPAANCVPRAKQAGATVVIVNGDPTEMDGLADAVLHGQIGEILPSIVGAAETRLGPDRGRTCDHDPDQNAIPTRALGFSAWPTSGTC